MSTYSLMNSNSLEQCNFKYSYQNTSKNKYEIICRVQFTKRMFYVVIDIPLNHYHIFSVNKPYLFWVYF